MAYGIVHYFPSGTKEQYVISSGPSKQGQIAGGPNLARGWRVSTWLDSDCDP